MDLMEKWEGPRKKRIALKRKRKQQQQQEQQNKTAANIGMEAMPIQNTFYFNRTI